MLTLILSKWREILILLLGAIAFHYKMLSHQTQALVNLQQQQITTCESSIKDARDKLDAMSREAALAAIAYKESERVRIATITSMTKQVNSMRMQQPPKDCTNAIEWAVKNKGELSWPSN